MCQKNQRANTEDRIQFFGMNGEGMAGINFDGLPLT